MAETVQNKPIKVDTYNDVAWVGSWKQRAAGMWAAGGVGLMFGALTGLVAPFFPAIVGAISFSSAAGLVASSVATFAAGGIVAGAAAGGLVGLGSGGTAAVAEEKERREKAQMQEYGVNMREPAKLPEEPKPQGLLQKIGSYLNPRAGMIFIALGMVAGAIFAAAAMPAILSAAAAVTAGTGGLSGVMTAAGAAISNTGIAAIVAEAGAAKAALAVTAYTVGVMGCFGALFGVRFAHMTNDARNVTSSWLSTKFGDEKEKGLAPALQQSAERETAKPQTLEAPAIDVQAEHVPTTSFASKHASTCSKGYKDMLAARANESAALVR